MIVNFNKKDLTLESKGLVSGFLLITKDAVGNEAVNKDLGALSFEGFAGMNENYIKPLLEMLYKQMSKKDNNIYKAIHVAGNLHNDDTIHEATFYIIKQTRDTLFLFKTLKSFSITLPDLRLGYESDKQEVLYLDKKILKVLTVLPEESKQQLVLYFYCLVRFFKAFNETNPAMGAAANGDIVLSGTGLNELYTRYDKLPDEFSIECIQLKEDVYFGDMYYLHSTYIPFIKEITDTRYTATYVYNVIKTSTTKSLCIINVSTKDYYVIDIEGGTIYTNSELREYNTFDMLEWIPNLVYSMAACKSLPFYRVKYLKLEQLLHSKSPEVTISNDASEFEQLLELYPTISENTNMKLYEGYFQGSKIITDSTASDLSSEYDKDEYAQELYKQVQPYYADFELKDLTGVVKGVAHGDVYSMLFEGESGTGKSTAARVIASRCGLPFVAINCSTNIEESDIFGTMIPNPEKNSADDPEFIWQDGPLTKAIRYGYVGIIEELGFARPGVLGKINSLLDESRQIDLPNGEVLKAHKNFRVIATTNIGYEGTNRLNKALVNRFEICKKFVDLEEKEAKAVIMSRLGYTNQDKITKVFDVYRAIKKYNEEQNLGLVISIRQLLNIFKQGKYYKNAKDALKNLLLNQAFLEEPEHYKHFTDTVLGAFDLSFKI